MMTAYHVPTKGRPLTDFQQNIAALMDMGCNIYEMARRTRRCVDDVEAAIESVKKWQASSYRKQRRCLQCHKPFTTTGQHLFVCDPCKGTALWRAGV